MADGGVVRVLLAEDEPGVRRAIVDVIEAFPTMRLVAVVGDAEEAIAATVRELPDVAVLDVRMPEGGGARAAREIAARAPGTRVVALSAHDDRESVASMLRAGALGYVVKGGGIEELIEAIQRAARGLASLSGAVATGVSVELEEGIGIRERREREQLERVAAVRQALEPGAIRPVFQPIVDLTTGEAVGFEALSRFAVAPIQPPDWWFKLAAGVGLLEDLELAAIHEAVAQIERLPRGAYLSLNLSPDTASAAEFEAALLGLERQRTVLEVTEHAEVPDYMALAEALTPFRQRGARLAVDDAGAGFASLRHILQLEPDIIKLDISITRNVDSDRSRHALASALASFGEEMGIELVAEGIETRTELEALRALGVRFGQGYFLGRPAAQPTAPDWRPT
jgi:EAL domain-containing protein (putative c-di-GMP-specific phosphodiesterase class I)/CheY-like chemotaxis protein